MRKKSREKNPTQRHENVDAAVALRGSTVSAGERKKIRDADPFIVRERERYSNPLPSREYIEQILVEQGVPMTMQQLVDSLAINQEELYAFERRLLAMESAAQLIRNRRGALLLPSKADMISGRIIAHPDGFGFLVRDDGQPDIFLGNSTMQQVMHGDKALVHTAGLDSRGRIEGKVVEVTEHANEQLVGRLENEQGVLIFIPADKRINHEIFLQPTTGALKRQLTSGTVVVVDLLQQPSRYQKPIARVSKVLGTYADPGMEIEIALRKHDLPFEFPAEVNEDARKLPTKVRKKDLEGRVDLREMLLVTIDGETAKDFDDAVFCEPQGKDFRVVVAIADVSHYVQPGDALDKEALNRGNSVYFPRRVIPMLPETLSNGLCSLNPQVERLAMVCDMHVSANGIVGEYAFYPAVIFSHARLQYDQVAEALYGEGVEATALRRQFKAIMPHLQNLDKVFHCLLKSRHRRGAIDFETTETRMIFDDQGKIGNIIPETRNDAHRIIEECMLAANVCSADFLSKNKHVCLYRVHEGPSADKLAKLRNFLAPFGLLLPGGEKPTTQQFGELLEKMRGRPDFQLLQTFMLRSLKQAVYSPDNEGHFGLAYPAYTHFTSPIRRYPDLLVHRSIKAILQKKTYQPSGDQDWHSLGVQCSMTERRADEASRDVTAWLKCYYMRDRVGEEFDGSVSSVTSFGLFVALDDLFVEGLVHISDLGEDYFHFDEANYALVGERSGARFRQSDRLRVQLVRVDLERNKIDFRPVRTVAGAGDKRSASVTGLPEKTWHNRRKVKAPAAGEKLVQPGRKATKIKPGSKAGSKPSGAKPKPKNSGAKAATANKSPAKTASNSPGKVKNKPAAKRNNRSTKAM